MRWRTGLRGALGQYRAGPGLFWFFRPGRVEQGRVD